MNEITVLITGSTDGIGQECALQHAWSGARVLLHGRNPSRGQAVLEHIRKATGNKLVELFLADFTSLKQVRGLAVEVSARYPRIDVLVNNAGTYMRERQLTEDGFETTFAVNHLAPYLLTTLLLGTLKAGQGSRIVNVSSMVHQNAGWDFNNLQGEKRYDAYAAYSLSKLANLLFTYELSRRLDGSGVTVNALHPGVIATKLLRAGFGSVGGGTVKEGADRIMFLSTSSSVEGVSGKYFVSDVERTSSPDSRDEKLQKELWTLSEKLTGKERSS